MVSQGVTTIINGNCGVSIAPLTVTGELPQPLGMILTQGAPLLRGKIRRRRRECTLPPRDLTFFFHGIHIRRRK
jgi:N-acyl-D-amino-acid deacylase